MHEIYGKSRMNMEYIAKPREIAEHLWSEDVRILTHVENMLDKTYQYGNTYGKYGVTEKRGESRSKCDFHMVMFFFNKNKFGGSQ